MIVFDLVCNDAHEFEGWFRDAEEYHSQLVTGLLTCPICGDGNVIKVPSASHINLGKTQNRQHSKSRIPTIQNDALMLSEKIHQHIINSSEDVGSDFTNEAKKIHYGIADERNIHGVATLDEVLELHDEGIDAFPIPASKPNKDKLN